MRNHKRSNHYARQLVIVPILPIAFSQQFLYLLHNKISVFARMLSKRTAFIRFSRTDASGYDSACRCASLMSLPMTLMSRTIGRDWVFIVARGALEEAGCELDYIGPLRERHSTFLRAKTLLYRKFKRQAFQRDREPSILDGYARQIERRLQSSNAKIVFSPGSVAIAHLQSDLPVVFWSDGTYAVIQEAYKWELPKSGVQFLLPRGNAMEQRLPSIARGVGDLFFRLGCAVIMRSREGLSC